MRNVDVKVSRCDGAVARGPTEGRTELKPYYDDGHATIYHGDCREILEMLVGVDDAIVTDPPYGISLENHGMEGSKGWTSTAWDCDNEAGEYVNAVASRYRLPTVMFASPWRPWSGTWPNLIVWDKSGAVGGGGDTATTAKRTWELIQARNVRCQHGRPESVWRVPLTQSSLKHHVTEKPEILIMRILAEFIPAHVTVIDPFMGSGTTLVAAKRTGRKAIGVEIDERYCEVAAERLAQGALFSCQSSPERTA